MAGGNRLYRVVGTLDLTTKSTKNTKNSRNRSQRLGLPKILRELRVLRGEKHLFYIWAIMASANSDVFSSFAPGVSRAKS